MCVRQPADARQALRHVEHAGVAEPVVGEVAQELALLEVDKLAARLGGARLQGAIDVGEQFAGLVVVAIGDVGLGRAPAGDALVRGDEGVAGGDVRHQLHARRRRAERRIELRRRVRTMEETTVRSLRAGEEIDAVRHQRVERIDAVLQRQQPYALGQLRHDRARPRPAWRPACSR